MITVPVVRSRKPSSAAAIAGAIGIAIIGVSCSDGDEAVGRRGEMSESAPLAGGSSLAVIRVAVPEDGAKVVWLGDSITHHALFTQYLETFFLSRYPQRKISFFNRGVAGDRAADVLARLGSDPVPGTANAVLIQLGMNDGGYRRYREEIGTAFRTDLAELLASLRVSGAQLLLVSPTVYDVEAEWRDQVRDGEMLRHEEPALLGYDRVMARLSGIAADLAETQEIAYADVRGPLLRSINGARAEDASYSLVPDSLHPSADGHAVMAVEILRQAVQEPGPVSVVRIERDANSGTMKGQAENGALSDVEMDGGTLRFVLHAKALPWEVPESARAGFVLAGGGVFNREVIQVSGLPARWYLLTIDDMVVGSFEARDLHQGIDLSPVQGTPQRQQARTLAAMNEARNQGPVRSRQDWCADRKNRAASLMMEKTERTRAEQSEAQREFDLWEESFRQAIVDLDAEAEMQWRELRELAQPMPRRYELRPLDDNYRPFAEPLSAAAEGE